MENKIDDLFKNKINKIDKLPENTSWNKEKGWNDFQNRYGNNKNKMHKLIVQIVSVAASILIVFSAIYFFKDTQETSVFVANNTHQIKKVTLPDGNPVWLNKNSSIQYLKKIDKETFEIKVKGEAYFEINKLKSKKYIIRAYNTITTVENSAKFNIRAYQNEANVDISIASGAVKVGEESYPEGLAILVTAGNYCSVHKEMKVVFSSLNKNLNYLSWKTGKLVFDNTSIETVVDVLEQYYHKQIILENDSIAYCYFSGTFTNQPIDKILQKIHSELGVNVKETGDKIILSGKSCLVN